MQALFIFDNDRAIEMFRGVINRKHVRDSDDPANSASREYPFVLSGDVIEPRLVAAMPPLPMFEPERRMPCRSIPRPIAIAALRRPAHWRFDGAALSVARAQS